jgi:hypothetical protein
MFSVIFSSRRKDNPTCKIENLLESFDKNSNDWEKQQTEFLIKSDIDDDELDWSFLNEKKYGFTIKIFPWGRHGGRHSLHEIQHYLYRHINEKTKWVQVIADDFEFTRNGFVSEILNIPKAYAIIGRSGSNCGSYAPCFSRTLLDVFSFWTPSSNADGFAWDITKELQQTYKIQLYTEVKGPYYKRTVSNYTGENKEDQFNKVTLSKHEIVIKSIAKNIYLDMRNSIPSIPEI